MADSSQQMHTKKKLVRVKEQTEAPPAAAITQKEDMSITRERQILGSFLMNVVLTILAIMHIFLGVFVYSSVGSTALGMAIGASQFVSIFAYAKSGLLLHGDAFPRWLIAVLEAGQVLAVLVCVVVICLLYLDPGQNGVRAANLFTWTYVVVLAVLTRWVVHVDTCLSVADFTEFQGDTMYMLATMC